MTILQQFTDLNCDFAKRNEFSEEKLACFMEIMHYVMKKLIQERHSEEDNFKIFKELLLRHAIKRPPHSLAIFSLTDVKKIDLFALDTFYRHFDMYKYALTVKDMLHLTTEKMMEVPKPAFCELNDASTIEVTQLDELQEYMSQNERDVIARQREYMENGPGKVESILNAEMGKLYERMDEQIKTQDEDFMNKVGPAGKR